jgi:hypothetical protein
MVYCEVGIVALQEKPLPLVSQESYRVLILHLQPFNVRRCSV